MNICLLIACGAYVRYCVLVHTVTAYVRTSAESTTIPGSPLKASLLNAYIYVFTNIHVYIYIYVSRVTLPILLYCLLSLYVFASRFGLDGTQFLSGLGLLYPSSSHRLQHCILSPTTYPCPFMSPPRVWMFIQATLDGRSFGLPARLASQVPHHHAGSNPLTTILSLSRAMATVPIMLIYGIQIRFQHICADIFQTV